MIGCFFAVNSWFFGKLWTLFDFELFACSFVPWKISRRDRCLVKKGEAKVWLDYMDSLCCFSSVSQVRNSAVLPLLSLEGGKIIIAYVVEVSFDFSRAYEACDLVQYHVVYVHLRV